MLLPRLIPCLLFHDGALVKTVRFSSPSYIGDPLNVVHIFNDKEVDELFFLDIGATPAGRGPDFETLRLIASEAFMPLAYGGGLSTLEEVRRVLALGFEKVVLNTTIHSGSNLLSQAVATFGSQSVVVSIDYRKGFFGRHHSYTQCGGRKLSATPLELAVRMEEAGAGEILLTSIDRDGTWTGYDLDTVRQVASAVSIPVVACGGARNLEDCGRVVRENGASGAAAGSMFVYQKQGCGVLIQYPDYIDIRMHLG